MQNLILVETFSHSLLNATTGTCTLVRFYWMLLVICLHCASSSSPCSVLIPNLVVFFLHTTVATKTFSETNWLSFNYVKSLVVHGLPCSVLLTVSLNCLEELREIIKLGLKSRRHLDCSQWSSHSGMKNNLVKHEESMKGIILIAQENNLILFGSSTSFYSITTSTDSVL